MTPVPSKGKKGFQLVSNHDSRLGLPVADEQVCLSFALWLDGELAELVARWAHLAAPSAGGRERAIGRCRR